MNIVDKIIQNLCGGSGPDPEPDRKNPVGTSLDNSGRIWKDRPITSTDRERANSAYHIISEKHHAWDLNVVKFNADNSFIDALMRLDCYNDEQKRKFMSVCRELAMDCNDEKEFYSKIQRGYFYGYVCENFGRPDLSVMKAFSPDDFPYFLAVCAACKNGYMREEALRLGAEYPMLLSIIIGGFNDRVSEVRIAAEKSFDIAFDSLARIIDEDPESCDIYPIYKMHPSDKPVRPRYKALAILFRTRARAADVSRGSRFDPEKLSAAEKRLDEIILKNLNEENIKYFADCYIRLTVGWFSCFDRLYAYRELYRKGLIDWETTKYITVHDCWMNDKACYMASIYTDLPEEGLRTLAACSERHARWKAVVRLFEKYGLWEGAEEMLTDPFANICETAVYYFEKLSDMDLHGFYMARLPELPAVGGLALCSHTEEQKAASADAIRPLVNSERTRTAAAAIYALAAVDDSESAAETFYELIKDGRPKVSRAALNSFLRCNKPVDCKRIYEDILQAIDRQKKWVLTNPQLLDITVRRLTSALYRQYCATVKKFPWILRLCVCENENVCREANSYVNWIVCRLYGLGDKDKEEIRQALDEVKQKGFRPYGKDFFKHIDFVIR